MLTSHQKALLAVNCVFPAFAVIATGLRLYARRLKNVPLRADDYTVLAALIFMFGMSMPFIYGAVKGGMGEHVANLTMQEFIAFGKVAFWTQFTYVFAVALVKLSILLLYSKVFTTRKFVLVVRIMEIAILVWTVVFFFVSLFQAWPINVNWNPEAKVIREINELQMYLALACTELVLDVATLALPWTVIWRLQMKTKRKLAISGIFMLGSIVCVASAFRIFYYHTTHTGPTDDFTYQSYNIFIWTSIEPSLGIVCACLPVLGPLFTSAPSPESIFSSIRSYIRLRTLSSHNNSNNVHDSRSKMSVPDSSSSQTGIRPKGNMYSSMADDAIILTSVKGRSFQDNVERDLESQEWEGSKGNQGIVVNKEFFSSNSPR